MSPEAQLSVRREPHTTGQRRGRPTWKGMRRFTGSPTLLWMVWRRCLGSWSRGRSVGVEWAAQWEPPPAQGLRGATAPFSPEAGPRKLQLKKRCSLGVPSFSSP